MKAIIPENILIEFTEAERKTISQSIDLLEQLLNLLTDEGCNYVFDNDEYEVDYDDINMAQYTFKILKNATYIK